MTPTAHRLTVPVLLGLLAPLAGADVQLYSQPTTTDDAKVGLGWYSNSEPRVRKNYKHADDFVLSEGGAVGRVVWWGQSSYHSHDDLTNFDSFQIEFFRAELVGDQWLPGERLATETLGLDLTHPAPTGRTTPAGAIEYRHDARLATPVSLDAGTRYFIAISAGLIETGSSSDAWQWQDADVLNGWSGVYSWASGEWSGYQDSDSAFELYTVPAPAGLVILSSAAPLRRRR